MLIKLKKRLSQNIHLYELLKGSSIALIMRLLGMLLVYVFSILLARSYGAETLGLFTLSLTVLNILTTIAVFGFDNTLVKFISEYNNKKKYHILSQIYKQSLIITMTISITLSIVLFLGSDYLALQIFNNPDLIIFFQIVSIGIVPSAFLIINASTFRGLKDIKNSSFFQNVGLYIFVIIILSLFINYYNGKEGLILAYIISIYFNAIVSYMAYKSQRRNK
jgi:O-antigen/teichoic acid export membrane protein